MVLALQTTTLDINTNVEARLKIMNGLSWHLVEDGYLGIGKHCRMGTIWTCQSGTSFTNCYSEQNRKMNIFELFLN